MRGEWHGGKGPATRPESTPGNYGRGYDNIKWTEDEPVNQTVERLNGAMNRIDGNKRGMDEVVGDIEESIIEVEALIEAATALYKAGRWKAEGIPAEDQKRMWEALRDALGLPAGTATAAGVGV